MKNFLEEFKAMQVKRPVGEQTLTKQEILTALKCYKGNEELTIDKWVEIILNSLI